MICSKGLSKPYHIISAYPDNYLHLMGLKTKTLTAEQFFYRCIDGKLLVTDFYIKDKGSVRRKIKYISDVGNIFAYGIKIQENFEKNKVKCSFATSDFKMTLGFIQNKNSVPMTLLKGNELKLGKPIYNLDMVFRKAKGETTYDEMVVGNNITLKYFKSSIKHLLGDIYTDIW